MKKLLRNVLLLLTVMVSSGKIHSQTARLFTSDRLTSTLITCITQDRQGYIWIGTQNGLNRFDGYRFTPYLHKEDDSLTINHNNITMLFNDRDGRLWVGTPMGIARYNEATDGFVRVKVREAGMPEPRITQMAQLPNGRLLVGTSGFGLFELTMPDGHSRHIDRYSKSGNNDYYTAIHVDRKGRLWKGDNNGRICCFADDDKGNVRLLLDLQPGYGLPINFLDGYKDGILVNCARGTMGFSLALEPLFDIPNESYTVESATVDADDVILLGTDRGIFGGAPYEDYSTKEVIIEDNRLDFSTTHVSAIFEDRQRNLWVGASRRGVLFLPHTESVFANWSLQAQQIKTGGSVESVAPDDNGGAWVTVGNGRLYHFNAKGHADRNLSAPNGLHLVWRDSQGRYWLTAGNTLHMFDEKTGRVTTDRKFTCDFIFTLTDDGHGTLFVATFGKGVAVYDTQKGTVRQLSMYQRENPQGFLCNDWPLSLLYDSRGLLWIGTSSGVSCYDPAKDSFKTFGWHNLLEGYSCMSLAEDRDGGILIGTERGLFRFDRHRNEVKPFVGAEELTDRVIDAIVTKDNGDLWCSTSMGIWHYLQADRKFYAHVNDYGLREREYINGVGTTLVDGRIVFANSVGLVVFPPAAITKQPKRPDNVRLTAMIVGNRMVNSQALSGGRQITPHPLSESTYFSLDYEDNTFSMEFSTLDFSGAANVVFEYWLNNDYRSRTANGQNAITFSSLQPGTYQLYVRAVAGGQYSAIQTYTITIRAPWYRTTMAYVIYLLVLLSLAGYIVWRFWRSRQQQLAEEKMQFLINATHDIRTPLTLILSPLHKLMMRKDNDAETSEKLGIIDHNARRILGLVNQILDIRKIDKQQMHLKCEVTNMVTYLNNIYKGFETYARERSILLKFEHPAEVDAWIDRVQFDKVIQNLLSNAFKFTPDGGEIAICLKTDDSQFTITVIDTGIGLQEEDIPKLFTRFYQSMANQASGKEGTGIGLNLCKMIVEMHHGTISAQNRTDGVKGSQFIVTLPLGYSHLKPEEIKLTESNNESTTADNTLNKKPKTRRRILLVDDDAEITDYIASELSDMYYFHACQNGKEALHDLLSEDKHYDLVVSDIMMPEMDGFTLLRTIKSNTKLSHLPVILLTSEAAVGNRLEGLQHGADAFLAKPFLLDELQITIDNLLAKSVRLKDKFSGAEEERSEQVEQRDIADNDKQLMDRIMQSVNKNLGDSYFSVEQLAADAGLSRSQLHRRMKELTGITPSDFIRNLRLEQAARLLRERKANISQVAYTLGFNTPGNFSKAFRQHFGMSPTEYIGKNE